MHSRPRKQVRVHGYDELGSAFGELRSAQSIVMSAIRKLGRYASKIELNRGMTVRGHAIISPAFLTVVSVAQLVELWIVAPAVAGSNPVAHPTPFFSDTRG